MESSLIVTGRHRATASTRRWPVHLSLAALLLTLAAQAATVDDLYGVTIDLLPGESSPSVETARRALAAVLVKVTGLADVTGSAAVEPVLSQAERLVQQQGFATRRSLRYVFDQSATRDAVLAAGLPYWDDDRPAVLVLLRAPADALATVSAPAQEASPNPVRRLGAARAYVSDQEPGELRLSPQRASDRRGLPLRWPSPAALDALADLGASVPGTARGNEPFDPLQPGAQPGLAAPIPESPELALARELGAELVLLGEVERTRTGLWQANWTLLGELPGRPWIGGLDAGPEFLADQLAARYAAYAGVGAQQVAVELTGIDAAVAYARTLAYLRRLDLIERIDLQRARPGSVRLLLSSHYEPAKLSRLLALAGFLTPAELGPGVSPGTLRFEYAGATPARLDAPVLDGN